MDAAQVRTKWNRHQRNVARVTRSSVVLALLLATGLFAIAGGCGDGSGGARLSSTQYATCSGSNLAACQSAFCNTNGPGCCFATSPPACFNPSAGQGQAGWVGFTQCANNASQACVIGSGPTTTATVAGVPTPTPTPGMGSACATPGGGSGTQVTICNQSSNSATVYISFYPTSVIGVADWQSFCSGSGLNCQFTLASGASQALPNANGKWLNFNVGFNNTGCAGNGTTLGEVNVNNPTFYDILDVSLVNGYNSNIKIVATPNSGSAVTLGPPNGMTGNETVYGVYPFACDVCVARCNPPCGYSKSNPLNCGDVGTCSNCQGNGTDGCHTGSQNQPDIACQYQGTQLGGGGEGVQVILVN